MINVWLGERRGSVWDVQFMLPHQGDEGATDEAVFDGFSLGVQRRAVSMKSAVWRLYRVSDDDILVARNWTAVAL